MNYSELVAFSKVGTFIKSKLKRLAAFGQVGTLIRVLAFRKFDIRQNWTHLKIEMMDKIDKLNKMSRFLEVSKNRCIQKDKK